MSQGAARVAVAEGIRFRYATTGRQVDDREWALDGVDLAIERGERVAVLGASGAGKSTLCRCLNGLIPHVARGRFGGRVVVDGLETASHRVAELAEHAGLVFQDFEAQLFCPTVELEVAFGPENLGLPRDEIRCRVRDALDALGLGPLASRPIHALSGGQKQRLAVAAVMALRPALLCLDEASSDLDGDGRECLAHLAEELARDGRAVVAADSEPEATGGCDKTVLLAQGRVAHRSAGPAPAEAYWGAGLEPGPVVQLASALGLAMAGAHTTAAAIAAAIRDAGYAARQRDASPSVPVPGEPVVTVRGLSHWYGPVRALDGVDLDVGRGEIVALIGRNGGGKSTLLRHLNGLLRPPAGQVTVCGLDVATTRARDVCSKVAYVAQNPDHQLFGDTVFDDVAFGPRALGRDTGETRESVGQALEAVGLVGREREDPITLSKGDRQRVAVAGALAQRPEVLVLDEPTTGLDHAGVRGTMELLRRLSESGVAILIVTHAMWVVAEYAHRAVVLAEGRIQADGTVRDVLSQERILEAAGLRAPTAARIASELGITALSVGELLSALAPAVTP